MSAKITVHYGSLAKPLLEQLDEQGYKFKFESDAAKYENQIDMATHLFFAKLLTRSEYDKVLQRMTKFIGVSVEKVK